MSDEELIARLREIGKFSFGWTADQVADRIEALTAERDGLLRVVTDNHVALQRAEAAETKLAKAVDGQKVNTLEQILEERGAVFDAMVDEAEDAAGKGVSFGVVVGRALRAAIAEIKGESHDVN